jgi:hypothetical protein
LLPNFIKQNVDAKVHLDRDDRVLRVLGYLFNHFNRNRVNLVVNVNAAHVLTIALNCVNQIIDIIVAIKFNVGVVHPILREYRLDHLLIDFGQGATRAEKETTGLLGLDDDVGLFLVKSYARCLNFNCQFLLLLLSFGRVQHHQNQIR